MIFFYLVFDAELVLLPVPVAVFRHLPLTSVLGVVLRYSGIAFSAEYSRLGVGVLRNLAVGRILHLCVPH